MSILVAGGLGFVGAHVCKTLAEKKHDVVAFDIVARIPSTITELPKNVRNRIRIVPGSVTDLATLLNAVKNHNVDGIISLAVVMEIADLMPSEAMRVNVGGCVNVCEAARIMDLRRVVYYSTQGVYGATKDLKPLPEDSQLNPTAGIYQLSKYMCELVGKQYSTQYGLSFVAIRPSFIFGPGQREMFPMNVLLVHAIKGIPLSWKEGRQHPIDYTYVKDVAYGTALAYEAPKPKHSIYNITGGKLVTNNDVIKILKKQFPGARLKVGAGLMSRFGAWDMRKILSGPMDLTRAKNDLGFRHQYGYEKGIFDFIDYLRTHEAEMNAMASAVKQLPGAR